jgi:hypothetical protein
MGGDRPYHDYPPVHVTAYTGQGEGWRREGGNNGTHETGQGEKGDEDLRRDSSSETPYRLWISPKTLPPETGGRERGLYTTRPNLHESDLALV